VLEVVVETDGFCDPAHAVVHRLHLLRADVELLREVVARGAVVVDRGVGCELERVVLDLDLTVEAGDRSLELALADVAPRTLHVRPDVDLDRDGRGRVGIGHEGVNARAARAFPAGWGRG
jgi:hypothetical protein